MAHWQNCKNEEILRDAIRLFDRGTDKALPEEMQKLIEYCNHTRTAVIIGCDANARSGPGVARIETNGISTF